MNILDKEIRRIRYRQNDIFGLGWPEWKLREEAIDNLIGKLLCFVAVFAMVSITAWKLIK